MQKIGFVALSLMQAVFIGTLMLASGQNVLRTALFIIAVTTLLIRVNVILGRSRRRSGNAQFSLSAGTFRSPNNSDLLELTVTVIGCIAVAVAALTAFRGGT